MNEAIDSNGKYCSPTDAVRRAEYTCPECRSPVIVKKGAIKVHHFAHKAGYSCDYFERIGEGALHRYAKLRLKHRLQHETLRVERYCFCCNKLMISDVLSRLTNIKVEHHFEYNGIGRIADVYAVEDHESFHSDIIFEIFSTHRTEECDRPDNEVTRWFEIDANDVTNTPLKCIRQIRCESCETERRLQQERFEAAERQSRCRREAEHEAERKQLEEARKRTEREIEEEAHQHRLHQERLEREKEEQRIRNEEYSKQWAIDMEIRKKEYEERKEKEAIREKEYERREAIHKEKLAAERIAIKAESERIDRLYAEYVASYVHPIGAPEPPVSILFEGKDRLHAYHHPSKKIKARTVAPKNKPKRMF